MKTHFEIQLYVIIHFISLKFICVYDNMLITEDLDFVNQVKEQVKEDLDFVNHIKDEFGIFQNIPKPLLSNNNLDGWSGKIEGPPFHKMSLFHWLHLEMQHH